MEEFSGIIGNLIKVTNIDVSNATINYRTQNGQVGSATGCKGLEQVNVGDVLILGTNKWEFASKEAWNEAGSVAVVRFIIDKGATLIVDADMHLKTISNSLDLKLQVGNTVEYSDQGGVLKVLSKTPIRSNSLGLEASIEDIQKEYLWDSKDLGVGFSEFGGYPIVKERARELIETQLERRERLKKIKANPVKGVLFTGPPGTGKTHLARIIARESGAEFYVISGPAIVSKWVGSSEDSLRKIFEAASNSKSGRAIVFFDEIDSIAERRSGDSHESSRKLVAQLLTLMDGFEDREKGVVVIAATNRVESLDPALMRPGRFDWEIEFGLPNKQDRFEILQVRAQKLATCGELPLEDIATLTEGWSAAELTAIWTEAALVAAGDDRESIAPEDVALAFERVSQRPKRDSVKENLS